VTCFHCGVIIGEWQETDVPWIEHAKYGPSCLYVIHVKGLEYIEKCQRLLAGAEP
jgi:hypothetical protein